MSTDTTKPIIEIKGLSKRYRIHHQQKAQYQSLRDDIVTAVTKPFGGGGRDKIEDFWALKDITFDVNRGDSVGIIGRNGSGKSTLLKLLSRIVDPTAGEAILRGKSASLLEVGTGFHPELTGRENIYFNGSILGMTKKEIDAKFDEIVAFAETEKFLDTPVKFYSSGMYVRLAFAVAAHLDPDILIVDEVLAVGDAAFQKKCLGKMKDVTGQGRTVLFVSHSMSSIRTLCNKAVWLDGGKIMAMGDIDEVSDKYVASVAGGVTDLKERKRTTLVSLEAKITEVRVSNPNSDNDAIDSKKPIEIDFKIEATKDVDDVVLHAGVNAGGQMVIRLMSEFENKTFDLRKGVNHITCTLPPTGLTGGTYGVDVSMLHPGRETSGHIDEVFDALVFSVREYKIEPGGQLLSQREAVVYAPAEWELSSAK